MTAFAALGNSIMNNQRASVLIVDDDLISTEVLTGLLEGDFHILSARDGLQALAIALGDEPPDLILLDILMPGMDGYDVCARLKDNEKTRDIPVIFLSSMDEIGDEIKGLELGAVDYVTKPVSQPLLLARIRTHLALNQTRQRLQGISNNLLEGIALVGRSDRLLFVNRPALKIMGMDVNTAPLIGQHRGILFRLKHGDRSRLPWQDVISGGSTYVDADAVFVSPSGQEVPVSYGCSPLVTSEFGRAAIITFRDISAQKRVQFQAMQAARQAAIGHLAAGIAHEINTPGQYILSNIDYIAEGIKDLDTILDAATALADDALAAPSFEGRLNSLRAALANRKRLASLREELPKAAAESREGTARINHLVASMKEFSQPGATGRAIADINGIVTNTLTISRPRWQSVAKMSVNLAPELPPVACCANELGQVVLNLILNAVQAIEGSAATGAGMITVTTRNDDQAIEIEVTDNGPGMPAAIREHIFDPFFTTKAVGAGTGLGLAICHDLVTVKHGGSISLADSLSGGMTFTVRLPVNGD